MRFLSLQPFVPSGSDMEASKNLFLDLGFTIRWDAGDYISFQKDACMFILQSFDQKAFAQNFMISVAIEDADAFYQDLMDRNLAQKYQIRIAAPVDQPYGREVNLIDLAGVCWHFVQ